MNNETLFFLFAWEGYLEGLCFDHYRGAFPSLEAAKEALIPLDTDGDWNAQVLALRDNALVLVAVRGYEQRGQWLNVPDFTPLVALLKDGAVIERVDTHTYTSWGEETLLYIKQSSRVDILPDDHPLYALARRAGLDNRFRWERLSTEGRDGRTVSRLRLVRQHPALPVVGQANPQAALWQEEQRLRLNVLDAENKTE